MPSDAYAWAAMECKEPLAPFRFQRRDVGEGDVEIQIRYCGVCHSDLHQVRDEWGRGIFPMVPGHEIVGDVVKVGSGVTKYKVGDRVGVGCMVDSCLECKQCKRDVEQYCTKGASFTYNSRSQDKTEVCYGGYSDHIVVREHFVLKVPENLEYAATAPLLCAGVTTWAPLKYWGATKGTRVGVVGLGGLGHMAVKLAHAMGAVVTVFTTSQSKIEAAKKLGADHVIISKDASQMEAAACTLDLIIDTVGGSHDLNPYIATLDVDGKIALVGMPEVDHPPLDAKRMIAFRRSLGGSNIGGIKETQDMLDFCGAHGITADIELIQIDYINEAYERMLKSDVKYRFVIDIASIKKA